MECLSFLNFSNLLGYNYNLNYLSFFDQLGANIHARDHSGKKPKDVVKDTVAADVKREFFFFCCLFFLHFFILFIILLFILLSNRYYREIAHAFFFIFESPCNSMFV